MEHFFIKDDVVQIEAGIIDRQSGIDLGGWQGRIHELLNGKDGELVAYVRWDSHTIKKIPDEFRRFCINHHLSWLDILMGVESLHPAAARDTVDKADWERSRALSEYYWSQMGETGNRICSIFNAFDAEEGSVLQAWEKFLKQNLTLPFTATMKKRKKHSAKGNQPVVVHDLNGSEETYGNTALVEINQQWIVLPITDIQVPRGSSNYEVLEDYKFWFVNR